MKRSIQIAIALIMANFALITAPGIIIMGLAGITLEPLLPQFSQGVELDLNASGLCGILWPAGIPPAAWALQRWKYRWPMDLYSLVLLVLLYLWAVVVVATVLLLFG